MDSLITVYFPKRFINEKQVLLHSFFSGLREASQDVLGATMIGLRTDGRRNCCRRIYCRSKRRQIRQLIKMLTLSLRRGAGLMQPTPPPPPNTHTHTHLSNFPSCHLCLFANITIRLIYPPFVRYPRI